MKPRARFPSGTEPALGLLKLLLAADAVVVALFVVSELGGFYAGIFNLDEEQNLPTWLSSSQFLGVAIASALVARKAVDRERLAAFALSIIFVYFSMDEVALAHEKLAAHAPAAFEDLPKLPILYSPIGIACAAAVWILAPSVRRVFGSALPLLGGFGLLAASLLLDAADIEGLDLSRFRPLIIAEEGAELCGSAVLTAAFLALALAGGDSQRQEPEPASANAPASGTNRQS
jgi:hypothetical protein